MAKNQRNFVSYWLEREVGINRLQPRTQRFNTVLQMKAEDKAATRDGEEISCALPRNPRSTLLMAFSADSSKVASTHGDHNIYVSDVKTGRCLHTLEGHPRTPWCIAFHPSSNDILASGCLGGVVRVWDLHGGSEVWMTQQNWVIASLAFHPFDQVLVIATYNEIYFWDWNQSQPFARCKTASDREKVRYVKFDALGHKLITGIANLPLIQTNRTETTRTLPSRFATLIEHYNRVLEARREQQRSHTQNMVGTDPVITNDRPTSPTHVEALQSARQYAQEVTSNSQRLSSLESEVSARLNTEPAGSEEFNRNSWRYRDPLSLRVSALLPSNSMAVHYSSTSESQEPNNRVTTTTHSPSNAVAQASQNTQQSNINQPQTEMSLPSSLIQALIRLQRSLETLTQTRLHPSGDRNRCEQAQAHLRQRIEEILNRLFNLYASITPLRILMNEVFQDIDRESLLAEVNRVNSGLQPGQPGLDTRLQELRQQLSRLLERIFNYDTDRHNNPSASGDASSSSSSGSGSSSSTPGGLLLAPRDRGAVSSRLHSQFKDSTVTLRCERLPYSVSERQSQYHAASNDSQQSRHSSVNHSNSNMTDINGNQPAPRLVRPSESLPLELQRLMNTVDETVAASTSGGQQTSRRMSSSSLPQFRIDPVEPSDEGDTVARPIQRPRSPPLPSMLNNQQPNRQQYVDYQAASASNSGVDERAAGNSLFLHPNYVASLLDDSTQRTNALQNFVFNRDVARTFLGAADFAVVNNVISLTHRIQCWDFSRLRIPDISDAQINIVVPECKIHNDASIDISSDGRLLATLVPGNVELPTNTIVGLYSLDKHNFGSCLYRHYFGPNVISVSLSPLSRYILIGLASRRVIVAPSEKQVVAQVFQLRSPNDEGQENLELVRNIQQCGTSQVHVSLNSTRWLPQPGQGIVYGTNRGDLRICIPGPARECDVMSPPSKRCLPLHSGGRYATQSTSTQTVSPQTQSAGTQTGLDSDSNDEIVVTSPE